MRRLLSLLPSVILGSLLGIGSVLVGSLGVPKLLEVYDDHYPVVEMHGTIVSADEGQVIVHMAGRKLRSCKYLSLAGYWRMGDGELKDANEDRIDVLRDGTTRPLGAFDIGVWRIWPRRPGSVAVVVYVSHNCGGRLVVTKIADEVLPP